MDDLERCRSVAADLAMQGLDKRYLKETLMQEGFSEDSISQVQREYTALLKLHAKTDASRGAPTITTGTRANPQGNVDSLLSCIFDFILRHYVLLGMLFLLACLVIFLLAFPDYTADTIAFIILKLPKALIFAVLVKVFVEHVFSGLSERVSWGKAILLGIVFAIIPIGVTSAFLARWWWMSTFLFGFCIIPLTVFYGLDVKQAIIIVAFAIIISVAYEILLIGVLLYVAQAIFSSPI